ncbi:hypothetical protein FF38_09938 [Lucilia cuprina]|uniref:Uncharacterized protein n=1 Tax=Lucilia cuprina TaxID=7375 RepID=A0A0L0CFS9_LUCCU|nr:hypothetical protein FF38_09938 [Lucilia cuprina]
MPDDTILGIEDPSELPPSCNPVKEVIPVSQVYRNYKLIVSLYPRRFDTHYTADEYPKESLTSRNITLMIPPQHGVIAIREKARKQVLPIRLVCRFYKLVMILDVSLQYTTDFTLMAVVKTQIQVIPLNFSSLSKYIQKKYCFYRILNKVFGFFDGSCFYIRNTSLGDVRGCKPTEQQMVID